MVSSGVVAGTVVGRLLDCVVDCVVACEVDGVVASEIRNIRFGIRQKLMIQKILITNESYSTKLI